MHYKTPQQYHDDKTCVHKCHTQLHITPISSPLYVVTCVSNPQRYANRFKHYHAFAKHVEDSGAILYTVELALSDRHFEITDHCNPRHIQLRSNAELWHKENLLNIGVSKFPADWKYGAYMDADVLMTRPDWVQETLHMLQHYNWVQMFSYYADLDHFYNPYRLMPSFANVFKNPGQKFPGAFTIPGKDGYDKKVTGATGAAWAFRRSAFDEVGGLLDICILGSADWHMSFALSGKTNWAAEKTRCTSGYMEALRQWAKRAESNRGSVGYINNYMIHYWHGNKANRQYATRWQILQKHNFDPMTDIKKDWQGVYQWCGNKPALEEDVRKYFVDRFEDGI